MVTPAADFASGVIDFTTDQAPSGVVTSLALATADPTFQVTGSPVTGAGTINFNPVSQAQNLFYASPSIGSGLPSMRIITQRDIVSALQLTTKGDLEAFGVTNQRFPAGADGTILTADSSQSVGLAYYPNIVVNVKSAPYLAKGDNSTDDTTAIQNAINAVQSAGGGIVYLPPSIYKITGTLTITAPGVYLLGAGQQATFLNTNQLTADMLDLGNTGAPFNCCGVAGISFISSVTRTNGWGVAVAGAQEVTIENVRVQTTGGHGMRFGAGGFLAAICYTSKSQIFTSGAFIGIQLDSGNDRFFDRMWLQGNSTAASYGVNILSSGGDWFQNMESVQYEQGFRVNGGTVSYLSFINCLADTNTVRGFNFTAGTITGVQMIGCWSSSSGVGANTNHGLQINVGDGYTITNHRAFNNGGQGIRVGPGAVSNVEIIGAQVSGNSVGSSNTVDGILVDVGSSNTKIIGGRSKPMLGFANTQRFGITNSSTTTTILGLDAAGNATGTISSVAGVGTRVMDCPGFNPRGTSVAQPAVPASTVAQNNTTGQDCLVYINGGTLTAAIQIGGVSIGLPAATTNIGVQVPAGSSITLTYTVAPTWEWVGV